MNRYDRQILLGQIGEQGQARLARARVLLIGCGALGSTIAEQLVRGGIGTIRIIDRDIVELTNLQRQSLFDESDAAAQLPKAVAAAKRLRQVDSTADIDPVVADVHAANIEQLLRFDDAAADVILDGTDNVATRYLINDVSVKHAVPWVYGGCVGVEGRVMSIRPGITPCLRCVFPQPPEATSLPTCDTAGVLASAAAIVASLQSISAVKLLIGSDQEAPEMLAIDAWTMRIRPISLHGAKRADCRACAERRFEFLNHASSPAAQLCGRNAVQIRPAADAQIDPATMEMRLRPFGIVRRTPYFVRCALHNDGQGIELTVFADGRTIVHGTSDPSRARSIHSRLVGA